MPLPATGMYLETVISNGVSQAEKEKYHMWNVSPVQVQCRIQDAWGWCTGMTQRGGTGREVGGGFRMGNTCTPMVDSSQCMAKPIQYCKVISLQLKYINFYFKKS